jgi:2-succinyl-6-hydroxy-2,4-cyclohexadiene-1-carboxylate synthase
MVNYFYQWYTPYQAQRPTIICLHGFTGTSNTFQSLIFSAEYNYLGIDLIGHGNSSVFVHPDEYQMEQVVNKLQSLVQQLGIPTYYLLGYSMGGRVALAWGLQDANVQGIILESASPGLTSQEERNKRIASDNKLARRLLTESLIEFVDFWQELPLFASQKQLPASTQATIRTERMSQQAYGLAMSLYMMGTGQQPSYWQYLETTTPMLLITGEWDQKFQQIAYNMRKKNPRIQIQEVSGAGHCVHIEQSGVFCQIVEDWLKENAK